MKHRSNATQATGLLVLLLVVLTFSANAQRFNGGVTGGFTAAQIDGDSYAGFDKLGWQGGVFVETELVPLFDARLEIRYTSRGARNPAGDDNTGGYFLALHYIDLPVLAALKIKKAGAVEIGLVPGYLFALNGEKDNGILTADDKAAYHHFDLGTLLGFRVNVTAKLAVSFRYSYSIFSIRDLGSAGSYYSWFGQLFGHSKGDFNNYLSLGIHYQLK